MVGNALFLMVMWAASAFLVNRLYVIVRHRAINIKGVTYSKTDTPIMYWIQMALLVFALAMIGSIAFGMTLFYADVLN
jgi:hypothetical protein